MSLDIRVVRGNITTIEVDAVVTAGNSRLVGGSGVNGAVHAAAGPRLLDASRSLAPCPAGSAVITPAFDLPTARWIIHAVGPRYNSPGDAGVLASAYASSLSRADEVGARSVAFPSISTGTMATPKMRPPACQFGPSAGRRRRYRQSCASPSAHRWPACGRTSSVGVDVPRRLGGLRRTLLLSSVRRKGACT